MLQSCLLVSKIIYSWNRVIEWSGKPFDAFSNRLMQQLSLRELSKKRSLKRFKRLTWRWKIIIFSCMHTFSILQRKTKRNLGLDSHQISRLVFLWRSKAIWVTNYDSFKWAKPQRLKRLTFHLLNSGVKALPSLIVGQFSEVNITTKDSLVQRIWPGFAAGKKREGECALSSFTHDGAQHSKISTSTDRNALAVFEATLTTGRPQTIN